MAFSNRPAGHASGVEAPSGQKVPGVHVRHAVRPLAFWYLPASQATHSDWRLSGLTVPGAHGVAAAEPIEQKEPAGHSTQSSSLVIERLSADIAALWWRPCGQGSAAEAPARQYVPGVVQTKQAVWPNESWYRPASQ